MVFLFLKCFIACVVSAAVVIIGVGVSNLVCLLIILYVGLEECVVADLEYLFSVLAFCMSVWAVLCDGFVGALFGLKALTVFHITWDFFFGPSLLLGAFPIMFLCCRMRCVILWLGAGKEVSSL